MQEQQPYEVSARKYRPKDFDALVGQDNIARTLRNSIVRGQLAHAYLFCGPRGVVKCKESYTGQYLKLQMKRDRDRQKDR